MDHQEVESKTVNNLGVEIKDNTSECEKNLNEFEKHTGNNETILDAPSIFEKQLSELQNKYLLLAADFDNYRKRSIKQIEDIKKYSLEPIIKDLLEVIDNLERAIRSSESSDIESESSCSKDFLRSGIINIKKQFITILESYGVTKIDVSIGSEFNPYFHEAINYSQTKSQNDGTILSILKDGYLLHSKVLRPTSVIVAKNEYENV